MSNEILKETIEDYGIAETLSAIVQIAHSHPSRPCLDKEELLSFAIAIESMRDRFQACELKLGTEDIY